MNALEDDLAGAAWAVVVTSRSLERRWMDRHPRIVRIPNGVDLSTFGTAAVSPPLPPDITSFPRPRLGYIGTIGRWLDLALLAYVARQRPNCSIVLVGPTERGVARPSAAPNLHWLGERPYASLPAYLTAMDVLLIPFRLMDLTHAVNPIKFYEYCASGKPIAATPLEEVVAFKDVCYLGEGLDSFLRAVDDALVEAAQPDPARIIARQDVARANTWDQRVADFIALLDEPER
jgi:glycosyltransferase involved in cell wall biosynthesis